MAAPFPSPAVQALLQEQAGRAPTAVAGLERPRIVLHQGTGQEASCLEGLVAHARRQAQDPMARTFGTLESYADWSYALPVVYDYGEGPTVPGCQPAQRSRGFADVAQGGGNCWEMTALLIASAIANEAPIEIHVYDVVVNGQRHIFPAVRDLGDPRPPEAVVLQPPVLAQGLQRPWGRARAQVFYQEIVCAQGLTGENADRAVNRCGRYLAVPDFGFSFSRCMEEQRELVEDVLGPYLDGAPVDLFLDHRVFDAGYYLGQYPDLQDAYGDDLDAAAEHWLRYGMLEGRRSSPTFDVREYLARYPDLQSAYGGEYPLAVRHFVEAGIREGRQGGRAQGGPDRGTLKTVSRSLEGVGAGLLGVLIGPQMAGEVRKTTEVWNDAIIDNVTDEPPEETAPFETPAVDRLKAEEAQAARADEDQPTPGTGPGTLPTVCTCREGVPNVRWPQ